MQKLLASALLLSGLAFAAQAADTSLTVVQRRTLDPSGVTPRVGYAEATASAGAESAQTMTMDVVKPNNSMAIIGYDAEAQSSNGSSKILRYNYNSTTAVLTIQSNTLAGLGAAGQISASDTVKVNYKYGY